MPSGGETAVSHDTVATTMRPSSMWSPLRTLLPGSATPDAARLVSAHALRSFADGFVSVVLASYLSGIGFSPLQIGAIAWILWPMPAPLDLVGVGLMAAAVVVTVTTGVDYVVQAIRLRRAAA